MKNLKIWSLLLMAAMVMVGCGNENDTPNNPQTGSLEGLDKEWCILTWDGVDAPFKVYIDFNSDNTYDMYQQVESLYFEHFSGNYTVSGDILTGTYSDGSNWACGYKASVSEDGMTLTLKSQEDKSITSVYASTVIPEEVKAEAAGSRAVEVVPFL